MSIASDPNLQVVHINDFTPGVHNTSKALYLPTFGPDAPLGSASLAYRCYAKKGVGLLPFPSYYMFHSVSGNVGMQAAITAMASLTPALSAGWVQDIIVYGFQFWVPPTAVYFSIHSYSPTAGDSTPYTSTGASSEPNLLSWPNMAVCVNTISAAPTIQRCITTLDAQSFTTPKWVTIPAWDGSGTALSGTFAPSAWVNSWKVLYTNGRTAFGMNAPETGSLGGMAAEGFFASDIQAMTNIAVNGPNLFYPELGPHIGSWGSISAGELFIVYVAGGGAVIYGDIALPSSSIKLPGVVGTGTAVGAGVQSSIGLIYVTDSDGAYAWNGGNTSQKISDAIPDDQLYRNINAYSDPFPGGGVTLGVPTAHNDAWGNWAMFANNWMFDTENGGWWQVENPAIAQFNVHCPSVGSIDSFYSADGYETTTCRLYAWNRLAPSWTWTWVSSPIAAQPGALVSLEYIEICATNTAPNPVTIVATPAIPSAQPINPVSSPLPAPVSLINQTQPQPVTFTIPPYAVAWRGAQRVGWSAHNLCVQLIANNSAGSPPIGGPAPTLHELTLGYTVTRGTNVYPSGQS
jgi:hypothetical protein